MLIAPRINWLGFLFAVALLFAMPTYAAEWYTGGTLHDGNGLDWQKASYANKLASTGDLVSAALDRKLLNAKVSGSIRSMNDIKGLSMQLVRELDVVFEPLASASENRRTFANQGVRETSIMLMMMMGWLK